jgi:hypothetical protein
MSNVLVLLAALSISMGHSFADAQVVGGAALKNAASIETAPNSKTPNFIDATEVGKLSGLADARLILMGDSAHYGPESKIVEALAIKTLEQIDRENHGKRKCLALEAEPVFDSVFHALSTSATLATKESANAQLEKLGMGDVTIGWIGDVYTMSFFEFAQLHGWTVRSGDMHRSGEELIKSVGENVDQQWLAYHQMFLRNQYMLGRLKDLMKKDCDLVVSFVGSAHLERTEEIPDFKVRLDPLPVMLQRDHVKSLNLVLLTNHQDEAWIKVAPTSPLEKSALQLIDAYVIPPQSNPQ